MKILQQHKKSDSPIKSSPKKRHSSATSQQQATFPAKRPKILLVDSSHEKDQKPAVVAAKVTSTAVLPWVDKYKPTSLKQLIGQQTDKSPANKLFDWLKNWARYHLTPSAPGDKKKPRPNPFSANSDGSAFKAALVSGPPGIGKTTAALMCCKELGLAFVELNASDARNKSSIDKISGQLINYQMEKYFKPDTKIDENTTALNTSNSMNSYTKANSPKKSTTKNLTRQIDHVLIMDEVDGMSGNADRAGIAELIQMIKRTQVPIICICNDRQSRKIRSLANYCFDLRFQRSRPEQIKGRLMSIMAKERANVPREAVDRIIEASSQDIRQCINTLQLMASGAGKSPKDIQRKDITVNIFEAARQILSADTPFLTKSELYFTDYSLMPLFVQENYPHVRASKMSNLDHLRAIRQAADSIVTSDIISRQIRSNGNWSLMNAHAMFSCALPATFMDGHMSSQIQFPAWFGKYSNGQKRQRQMRQLAQHTYLKISGSNQALVQDYLPLFRDRLYRPLIKQDTAGVKDVLEVYNHYFLLKEDTEAINELGIWPVLGGKKQQDLAAQVSTKAKSALTRQLNKERRLLPFSQPQTVKSGRKKAGTTGPSKEKETDGDDEAAEEQEADDLETADSDVEEQNMMEY